jgi:transcription antitermination factor NusG
MDAVIRSDSHPWYALQVRARHEKNIEKLLSYKGYTCFVPVYDCARRWGNRDRTISLPLFASYVFCRLNIHDRLPVLITPGVMSVVGFGDGPVPVDEGEMSSLITVIERRATCAPHPYLRMGDRARIVAGPLSGVEGILVRSKQRSRLILSVELLQRSVAVEVDETWIEQEPAVGATRTLSPADCWSGRQAFRPCV